MTGTDAQSLVSVRSGADTPMSRVVLRVLLVGELAVALAVIASQLPQWWAERWAQDDAYISFRYAKHLVQGRGLVYNPGAHVEGYTNFLWTMAAAIPLARGAEDPLPFLHAVSAGLWLASYGLLLVLMVRLYREGLWGAPLAVVPLAYHWSFNMWFFSGMETPLVTFLTIAVVFAFCINAVAHPSALLWTSLGTVALMMTRPDGVVILVAISAAGLVLNGPRLLKDGRWRTAICLYLLPILCIYVPYTSWRIGYYGSFYPNTYYAKAAYLPFYSRGWTYLCGYVDIYRCALLLPLVIVAPLLAGSPIARRFLLATAFTTAAVFLYVVRLGGDFMEWRFLTPITGVLYPAMVISAAVGSARAIAFFRPGAAQRAGFGAWLGGLGAMMVLTMRTTGATPVAQQEHVPGQETIGILRRYCDPGAMNWGAVGKTFDAVLPQNVTIATTSAGIIPFYCDRPCLDLHGLTDAAIAHEPVDPEHRGRVGHDHWLEDLGTMRERGVDVYLPWASPRAWAKALLTPPQPNFQTVSARLPDGGYAEFSILNDQAVDVAALRRDPRLVFYGAMPISARGNLYALQGRFAAATIVDALDLEDEASEQAHEFEESGPPGHVYHTKILHYAAPLTQVAVHDDGRRLTREARWNVRDVIARQPLTMVIRFDHTGGGLYRVRVNGRDVPRTVSFAGGAEAWDEVALVIPGALVVDGVNEFRMARIEPPVLDAELYYMWFLQDTGPSAERPGTWMCRSEHDDAEAVCSL